MYVSCTGLTVDEIYISTLQSCFVTGPFGHFSKLLANIKSINIFQTTIDFSFSSNLFAYNKDINTIIIDDIDRMNTNDFYKDVNKLLGILKNLETLYNFVIVYANKYENKVEYVNDKYMNGSSRSSNWTVGGFSFYKTYNNDRVFNELILKSNFNKFINVKLDETKVYNIIEQLLHDKFYFYKAELCKHIFLNVPFDLDIRSLKIVIADFNNEVDELKVVNNHFLKTIGLDPHIVGKYFVSKLKQNNLKRDLYKRDVTLDSEIGSFLWNYIHNDIRRAVPSELYKELYINNNKIDSSNFKLQTLVANINVTSSLYKNLYEDILNIFKEENIKIINKLWIEVESKYTIDEKT